MKWVYIALLEDINIDKVKEWRVTTMSYVLILGLALAHCIQQVNLPMPKFDGNPKYRTLIMAQFGNAFKLYYCIYSSSNLSFRHAYHNSHVILGSARYN